MINIKNDLNDQYEHLDTTVQYDFYTFVVLILNRLGGVNLIPPCGFSKNAIFRERVKL